MSVRQSTSARGLSQRSSCESKANSNNDHSLSSRALHAHDRPCPFAVSVGERSAHESPGFDFDLAARIFDAPVLECGSITGASMARNASKRLGRLHSPLFSRSSEI